jgi:pilus assembly protein CpaB
VSRRTRAVALVGLSAVCAGAAVSLVNRYASDVRAQMGPLAPVVVATKELPRGLLVTPRTVLERLAERRVPVRYVPPDSLRSTRDALGLRVRSRVPAGSYLGGAQLGPPESRPDPGLAGHQSRVVEVSVSGAATTAELLRPRARVDVLITSERGPGPPRTYLSLQRVALVGLRSLRSDAAGADDSGPDAVAALRVSLRQAVLLTAAQNFARELRLVLRPQEDDRRFPPTAVAAGDLHP